MPTLEFPADFTDDDLDYVEHINGNFDLIASFFNALAATVSATSGAGAVLLQDVFDRSGIVGSASYRLDVESYGGGSSIDIGRRPAPFSPPGETDVSIAWGLFSGEWDRVSQTGDITLDASGIIAGLPKTIYVGVPSTGIAQFYEDGGTANVIMLYSMTWDGADLSDFKRLTHILPGYTLVQALAAVPKQLSVFDGESDFRDGEDGLSRIVLPGAPASNGISLEGAVEVLGVFIDVQRDDEDGWYAASAGDPAESLVTLQAVDDDDDVLTESDIEIDCTDPIGTTFKAIDSGYSDKRFVTAKRTVRLKLVSVGDDVVSARCFTWGLWVKPLLGAPMPKDSTKVRGV